MKTSNFQIIVIGLSVAFLIIGVGVFAAFGGLLGGTSVGAVTIWGTMDAGTIGNVLVTLRASDKSFEAVNYVQKDPATYEAELLNAMAAGQGPDLFLISQSDVSSFADKITPVPYSAVSQAAFTGSYIDEGSLFLTSNGALALPLSVDPIVMYWNRDLYAAAGVAQSPQYWNDFLSIAPKITSLNGLSTVQRSAVALGTWSNVDHAKDILATLFMQAGDPITTVTSTGLQAVFGQTPQGAPENPAESALRFYTEFADPSKTTYSWNGALPDSASAFASGDLATYFGYASEYSGIAARNPNLHFSVAMLPQLQGNAAHVTFGTMTGVAISRTAHNPQGALTVVPKLAGQQAVGLIAQALQLPPARRDVVLDTSNNAAMSIFVQSSLIARAWLDPAPAKTDPIFANMINSVISGANLPAAAIAQASQELQKVIGGQ